MAAVGLFEAKTHLSRLVERVERGEEITLTRHGHPVAKLVPVGHSGRSVSDVRRLVAEFRRLAKGHRLGDLDLRDLIEDGRRV